MRYFRILFIFVIITSFVFIPSKIFSQTTTETNALFFKLDPDSPKAYSPVTITINSYSIDLNTPTISWNYNGKTIASGIGDRSITLTTGASGTSTKLTATIYSGVGTTYSATTYIEPSDIDMLWQAVDSYTPPFYKGKKLPSDESTIKVIAISQVLGTKGTSYAWTRNGASVQNSNMSKNAYAFTHNELNNTESIGVEAYSGGSTASENNIVNITPTPPSIITYQKLDGFVDYANGYNKDFYLNDTGTTLKIEPFFFSTSGDFANDLNFNITLGGQKPDTTEINEVPIIKPDSYGTSTLVTSIDSIKKDWQSAKQSLIIHF